MVRLFEILIFIFLSVPVFGQTWFQGGQGGGAGLAQVQYCSSDAFKASGIGYGFSCNGVYYCADGARYTGSGIGNGDVSNVVFYCDSANQRYLFHEDSTAAGGFASASQNYCTTMSFGGGESAFDVGQVNYCSNITYMGSESAGFAAASNTCQNPLPVTWIDFQVVKGDGVALLYWTTASESNNNYFEIQRTAAEYNFLPLGIVYGAGNSNTQQNYFFADSTPVIGMNYYRLHQVDFDGNDSYSEIRMADFSSATAMGSLLMYPNPLAAGAELNVYFPEKGMLQLEIFDINGRMVFNWSGGDFESNEIVNVGQLNLEQGLYVVRVYSSNSVFSGRLIAQ